MSDPLADVIHKAHSDWHDLLDRHNVPIPDVVAFEADAVRAHLAAVLNAEGRLYEGKDHPFDRGARFALARLQEALGVPE